MTTGATVTVISGGVGAARMLQALSGVLSPERLTAVVNTGDDTTMHGLSISPDLDTITYTLAGAIDPGRGGDYATRRGTRWRPSVASAVRPGTSTAGDTWFGLGDRDLGTHLYRTARVGEGASLTAVSDEVRRAFGVAVRLLPMSDQRVATEVQLADGAWVGFQDYFVRLRHDVASRAVRFVSAGAELSPQAKSAIDEADVVVIAPSNPLVSIGPIRSLPGVDELLAGRGDSVVAVSPIVAGTALKGPADRLLRELGHEPSVVGVARLYTPIAGTLVVDTADASHATAVEATGMRCVVTPTVMAVPGVAARLARATLAAAGSR